MRTAICLFAVSGLLLAPAAVRAGDAAPSPSERAARVLRALPPPSEKAGFKLDLDVRTGGTKIGTGRFEAVPGTTDGKATWNVTENFVIEVGPPKRLHDETSMVLAADLHLLRLDAKAYADGERGTTTRAVRTERGFDVVRTDAKGESSSSVEAGAQTLGSITSVILFLGSCPADPARYEVHAFGEEKGEVVTGTIEVKGAGTFTQGATTLDAWIVQGKLGENTFELYFGPTDRTFLALRLPDSGELISKAGILEAAGPAKTATECGARLALGILTSDEELLASAIHWPSMLADAKATKAFEGDAVEYKKLVMGGFRQSFRTLAHAEAVARVKGAADGAKETVTGDVTIVTFGPPMDKFSYSARSIDGAWYIVKFPD